MIRKSVLLVLSATAGLALKGIWARLAFAEGLDVPGLMFYRAALATPLFLICGVALAFRRKSQGEPPAPARAQAGPQHLPCPLGHAVDHVAAYLVARANAAGADDAQVVVAVVEGVGQRAADDMAEIGALAESVRP